MSIKTKSIGALFLGLVAVLAINPRIIYNVYNTILGRIILVAIVIFLSTNNLTLGLLLALAIISVLSQFSPFVEGMENGTTVGEDSTSTSGDKVVLTGDAVKKMQNMTPEQQEQLQQKMSDLKENINAAGVDLEAIKSTIQSKQSKTIPVDSSTKSSEEVSAFTSGMLGLNSSNLEGFCNCAGV